MMIRNISIAMTSCNGGKYIEAQIESILNQRVKPTEIIVCDDDSDDNTLSILSAYQSRGLLKLYRNDKRIGVINNFKKAVSLCNKNNYIALCDQDDYWLPGKLEENLQAMQAIDGIEKPTIVFSDLSLVDNNLKIKQKSFWEFLKIRPEKENLRSLLFGNFITGCSVMMNGAMCDLFSQIPAEAAIMHDTWIGLIAFTFGRYSYTNKPLVLYRQHNENVTLSNLKESTLKTKVSQNIGQLSNNKNYLDKEIQMTKQFYKFFETKLSETQKAVLLSFIGLEKATFIKKKLSSLRSRSYRYLNKH